MYRFEGGLRETVQWDLDNRVWVENVQRGEYRSWIRANYAQRLEC